MNVKTTRRGFLIASGLSVGIATLASTKFVPADEAPAKQKPDRLSGPPEVSAKAWAIIEGATGKFLWRDQETKPQVMASTTKIMTAWLVLDLQRKQPDILDQVMTVPEAAAKTDGSSAKILPGDRIQVRDLLYGLLLPSGNDAAAAFAEHCGEHYRQGGDPESAAQVFVAQMNRQAKEWGLEQTRYFDPHGLGKNHASAQNLAQIAWKAMQHELFRKIVQTRRYECEVLDAKGDKRQLTWSSTNRLLEIEGFDGIKTGTTTAAGSCLVSSGHRGKDHLIVVVLGSTSSEGRYVDTRNLYRWAWGERGQTD
ncbi:D-alanyl-D-alanine carboxypeptidase precursor [Anatilimnocola aggregata]|uniref:D-alanyl-D-alanine carboxypeptidase n=1 Tax=Anatilimnocola aggregata TaxID=2528021 RepID=A0A517YFR2_9BACT|nr:D-alanyl-D-alanine carboxypeptidase [Anatilimnocola aggregata]QDU29070.1 D-alanyl-D-alanine carboxypeptidase precursor [Anatilimnocola aggregata]